MLYGAPGGIRTHDPCLRRAVLYPAELLVRRGRHDTHMGTGRPVTGGLQRKSSSAPRQTDASKPFITPHPLPPTKEQPTATGTTTSWCMMLPIPLSQIVLTEGLLSISSKASSAARAAFLLPGPVSRAVPRPGGWRSVTVMSRLSSRRLPFVMAGRMWMCGARPGRFCV